MPTLAAPTTVMDDIRLPVDSLNAEHEQVLLRMNRVLTALDGRDPRTVCRALMALLQVADAHFLAEDRLMVRKQYPGLADHQERHRLLSRGLRRLLQTHIESPMDNDLADATRIYLTTWLVGHINGDDMRLARFLATRKRPAELTSTALPLPRREQRPLLAADAGAARG